MTPEEIERELHDNGDCDPEICRICLKGDFHPARCKCRECLDEKSDRRHHAKVDDEGPP